MPILLTGFEPFGDRQVNPSQRIVEHFQAEPRACPGTREDTIALLRFGILVLIVFNLVVAMALMWNVLT